MKVPFLVACALVALFFANGSATYAMPDRVVVAPASSIGSPALKGMQTRPGYYQETECIKQVQDRQLLFTYIEYALDFVLLTGGASIVLLGFTLLHLPDRFKHAELCLLGGLIVLLCTFQIRPIMYWFIVWLR